VRIIKVLTWSVKNVIALVHFFPARGQARMNGTIGQTIIYYGAEGGVLELLETGVPYAPHVKAKIT